jgi:hypothetical protein
MKPVISGPYLVVPAQAQGCPGKLQAGCEAAILYNQREFPWPDLMGWMAP